MGEVDRSQQDYNKLFIFTQSFKIIEYNLNKQIKACLPIGGTNFFSTFVSIWPCAAEKINAEKNNR